MKKHLLKMLINFLIDRLNPDMLQGIADQFLDWIEQAVLDSENEFDDALVLPVVNIIREAFGIPDNNNG